jgi:hypothetical protein
LKHICTTVLIVNKEPGSPCVSKCGAVTARAINLESHSQHVSWQKKTNAQRQNSSFEGDKTESLKRNKFYLEIFLFNSIFQIKLLVLQSADSLVVVSEDALNSICDGQTHTDTHT